MNVLLLVENPLASYPDAGGTLKKKETPMNQAEISIELKKRYASDGDIKALAANVTALITSMDAASEKENLMVELTRVTEDLDRLVHENIVLPVHKELTADLAGLMNQAADLAEAWQSAWYEFESLHAGKEAFPGLSVRNTAASKLVKG